MRLGISCRLVTSGVVIHERIRKGDVRFGLDSSLKNIHGCLASALNLSLVRCVEASIAPEPRSSYTMGTATSARFIDDEDGGDQGWLGSQCAAEVVSA